MGAINAVLQRPDVLHFSAAQVGAISSAYLVGAVLGSLVFGHLTDRYGRRMFFFVSLGIYLCGFGLTAFSWNLWRLRAVQIHHRRGYRRRVLGSQLRHR